MIWGTLTEAPRLPTFFQSDRRMSLNSVDREILQRAFDYLRHRRKGLSEVLTSMSNLEDVDPPLTPGDLFSVLRFASPNDSIRVWFSTLLSGLDYVAEGPWAVHTERSTRERRQFVYETLQITVEQQAFCEEYFPRYPTVDAPIVIADTTNWKPWYTLDKRAERAFYWPAYHRYLAEQKGWTGKNLAALDSTTISVLERLADPSSTIQYQAKGLVVGYVQSGKTAHYTGLIAKAVDAGYRLIIVLAGTINILREQTQRRLDKELLGWELVSDDYQGDPEQIDFLRHGGFPSGYGHVDWERLTRAKEDFQELTVGISALEFRRSDPAKPFYDPANLQRERARLVVVKKHSTVLAKLIAALHRAERRNNLNDVPALIIDDESDQASVNTRKPKKNEVKERTAINRHIIDLMSVLGRAQYIGYTATPFANVFIDPDDASDLYPSDFLISLPKPEGYMGVRDFYDSTELVPGDYSFNQNAFVRKIIGNDSQSENLPSAIDSYVLAGAIKLYRAKHGARPSRHHTMLVHHSAFTAIHRSQAKEVGQHYEEANYLGGGPGLTRLKQLWDMDYSQVCRARAEAGLAVPASFDELRPFVGECCRRINEGDKPVLVVNGDDVDEAPNFERDSVWKIIVGGTKLSRGYTVEGLTVSYYRRTAQTADTLMQMGRWFGYRAGYQDLVRLYIGTSEPLDRNSRKFINLYEAFHAICLDEEEFRADLARYSQLEGDERITPKQIPPLVPAHMLKPTAKNKMYNAVLDFENFGSRWVERTVAPSDRKDMHVNEGVMRALLAGTVMNRIAVGFRVQERSVGFDAIVASVGRNSMLEFLRGYRWKSEHQGTLSRVIEFLEGFKGDPEIDNWLVLAPQRKSPKLRWTAHGQEFDERHRERVETGGRYGVYSEPDHRAAAEYLAQITHLENVSPDLQQLSRSRQGVLLFYPVRSNPEREKNEPFTMGFGLQLPPNSIPRRVRYTVRRADQADSVTVERS